MINTLTIAEEVSSAPPALPLFGPVELAALWAELQVKAHPILQLPDAAQVATALATPEGKTELLDWLKKRATRLAHAERDPLRFGFKLPVWKKFREILEVVSEILAMGGNRSSKTECAADYACDDLANRPGRIWGFGHSSEKSSIRQQHPRIYKYLPQEWRDLGKPNKQVYVEYKEKTGFSDGVFILPNGSTGYFFNYQQDVKVLEGYEFDGVWCDELVPPDFLEAFRYRVLTRRGKLITTFTPVDGYTATVGQYLAGAQVLETAPSPLLPGRNVAGAPVGHMPTVLECAQKDRRVLFFFTADNPFNPYSELQKKLEGQTESVIKMRAYGWPDKQVGGAFPNFGRVNIIKRSHKPPGYVENGLVPPHPWKGAQNSPALYDRLPRKGMNVVFADPADAKNWFIKWYRIGEQPEHAFIYREWPDWARHGAWALPSDKADGKPGPAQRKDFGKGIIVYKKLILEAEGWTWDEVRHCWDGTHAEEIHERYIDPRLGGAEVPSEEEGTSIIALMEDEQRDEEGHLIGPSMIWVPAPTGRILDGLQLINNYLQYDVEKPVNAMNCPRLYVVEDCAQSIYALSEYTGLDGLKGALKDVIDPDRYFVKSDLSYVGPDGYGHSRGGSY